MNQNQPMYGTEAFYDYWRERGTITIEEQYLNEIRVRQMPSSIYTSRIDMAKLWDRIYRGWTKVWIRDGSGVLMSNGQSTFDPGLFNLAEPAVLEIEDYLGLKAKYLMVNILPAGVVVGVHTDTLLNNSVTRWHLPLVTNPEAWLWEEQRGFRHIPLGEWESVDFKKRHTIGNFGQIDRVHLIVDLW